MRSRCDKGGSVGAEACVRETAPRKKKRNSQRMMLLFFGRRRSNSIEEERAVVAANETNAFLPELKAFFLSGASLSSLVISL